MFVEPQRKLKTEYFDRWISSYNHARNRSCIVLVSVPQRLSRGDNLSKFVHARNNNGRKREKHLHRNYPNKSIERADRSGIILTAE